MKKIAFILVFFVACSSGKLGYNEAIEKNNKKIESAEIRQDSRFLVDAKSSSLLLQQIALLASKEAYAQVVNTYANKMLQDHKTLNEQLSKVADNRDITLPEKMSDSHQRLYDDLKGTPRGEFDRKFAQTVERVYEDNIQMYKNVATSANTDDVRSFAASKLSFLRENEQKADELEQQII